MTKVLVTGGAGFLGSHLCERLLADGQDVICLDNLETGSRRNIAHLMENERFSFVLHDVIHPFEAQVDEVYHLACPASPPQYRRNPVRTIKTAVIGTLHALELAREVGARLLVTSTSEVYGDPEQHPQREVYWGHVNPTGPRACYDEGKRCGEALITSFTRQYGIESRVARVFNTYGPRMQENDGRVVSNFAIQALRNEPITLYGDGRQTRSFCYASDTIEGLVRLMHTEHDPGPVNLGNPNELTVQRLAERILALTGSSSELVYRPLPEDDPTRRRPDIERAHQLLGWLPRVDLDTGLSSTLAYFRQRLHGPARLRPVAMRAAGAVG